MAKIAGTEFTVSNKLWHLVWDDIGEGRNGDYDSLDPEDNPLFRASLYTLDWEPVDDGSYCTLAIVGKATEERLLELSNDLFNSMNCGFNRRAMEAWTHRTA